MKDFKYPLLQMFADNTIYKIKDDNIFKMMDKKYIKSLMWKNTILVDISNNVYEFIDIEIIKQQKHFNLSDLFYTTCEVKPKLILLKNDDELKERLKILLGSLWNKVEKDYNMDNLYNFLLKAYNKQAIDC